MVHTVQTESQCPQFSWQNLAKHHRPSASAAWPLWKHADSADLLSEQPCFGRFTACHVFWWALKNCYAQLQQTSFHLRPPERWNHLPKEGKLRCTQVQLSLLHVQMKTSLTDSACNRNQALCLGVTTSHKETTGADGKKRPAGEGNKTAIARGNGRMKTQQRRWQRRQHQCWANTQTHAE